MMGMNLTTAVNFSDIFKPMNFPMGPRRPRSFCEDLEDKKIITSLCIKSNTCNGNFSPFAKQGFCQGVYIQKIRLVLGSYV